jgi:5-oxoprolinase (ATP-hydrolysing) subunit A
MVSFCLARIRSAAKSSGNSTMSATEHTIDLNADLGEGFPWDDALLQRVTSASVSCGAHAGDVDTIRATLRVAKSRGVAIGAHPSYPDRQNFGRKEISDPGPELGDALVEQLDVFATLAEAEGVTPQFVKPHGALYNQAQREPGIAEAIVSVVAGRGMAIVGQPNSALFLLAKRAGIRFVAEGFIDRRYDGQGRLVPRTEPDAILHEPSEIHAQIRRLLKEGIETLCIHGDNPESLRLADLAIATLTNDEVRLRSFA